MMERREFLKTSALFGTAPFLSGSGEEIKDRRYYELRRYHLLNRSTQNKFHSYLSDALIPALNRIGIVKTGVFTVMYGSTSPTIYLLLPHKSAESVVMTTSRLMGDSAYRKAGASFINTPISEPGYVRTDSSLMLAFKNFPEIETPSWKPGIYELRTYESHSVKAAQKKIEMFNEGGEIQIFRDTGLNPVFFGETLIGTAIPNLTYMLAFKDMAHRDSSWGNFRNAPAWKKLSVDPQYKDTVSNITDIILQPAPYSQI